MADYPASITAFPARPANMDDPPTHSEFHAQTEEEIVAIQEELGVDPAGAYATVAARMAALAAPTTLVVSSGFVDATGWNVTAQAAFRVGNIVTMMLTIQRTGAAVVAGASGDVGNVALCTAPTSIRGTSSSAMSMSTRSTGPVSAGFYVPSTGVVSLAALPPSYTLATSAFISLGGTFIVA